MGYIATYKKRQERKGMSAYERAYKSKVRDTKEYLENTLTREECFVDGRKVIAGFQDHSQSNNKDLSDDKYIVLENDVEIKIGSYVNWREQPWLVFTEEFKTIPTHQQLKIKIVNENIKWLIDRKTRAVCNNGDGWGAYVQNQTLYTLGIARQGNHLDLVNSKMMLYMQNNEETRSLRAGDRIFVGFSVYKIMFRDGVSRKGLINYLLEEDTIKSSDNSELRIANYYRDEENGGEVEIPKEIPKINGNTQGRIGRRYTYEIDEGNIVNEWIVETLDPFETKDIVRVINQDDTSITLEIVEDARNIGKSINVIARVEKDFSSLTVHVSSKY